MVVVSLAFLVVLGVVLLVVSPRLQANLGLNEPRPFPTPAEPVTTTLQAPDGLVATATWDAEGVCAEVTDASDTTFRTCADPDSLRPIWAIDAPDAADPAYLLVGTPPDVASIEGTTTDGEVLAALTQRELPAAWAIVPLPRGAVVERLVALDLQGSDLGDAECGTPLAGEDRAEVAAGPDRLGGGCTVPRQD